MVSRSVAAWGGPMTGPISFSVEQAREQLLDDGVVHTARSADRTTGETWANWERGGEAKLDVVVEKAGRVSGIVDLTRWQDTSGFKHSYAWLEAIRETHGVDDLADADLAVYSVVLTGYRDNYEGDR